MLSGWDWGDDEDLIKSNYDDSRLSKKRACRRRREDELLTYLYDDSCRRCFNFILFNKLNELPQRQLL